MEDQLRIPEVRGMNAETTNKGGSLDVRRFVQQYPVLVFVVLTLLTQLIIVLGTWWLIPAGSRLSDHHPDGRVGHMLFRLRVFFPLVYAVAITYYLDGGAGLRKLFGSFLYWRVPFKWYALAFGWKFVMGYVAIAGVVWLGWDSWPGWISPNAWRSVVTTAIFGVGIAVVEETAWIRFSVTRLQGNHSALRSAITVGFCWSAWYLMLLVFGEGVPDGIPWHANVISMLSLTIFLTWAFNTTRSGTILLIMQIFSNNAFVIVPMLPVLGKPPHFMNGFVVVFAIVTIVLLWRNGARDLSRKARVKWYDPQLKAVDSQPR